MLSKESLRRFERRLGSLLMLTKTMKVSNLPWSETQNSAVSEARQALNCQCEPLLMSGRIVHHGSGDTSQSHCCFLVAICSCVINLAGEKELSTSRVMLGLDWGCGNLCEHPQKPPLTTAFSPVLQKPAPSLTPEICCRRGII